MQSVVTIYPVLSVRGAREHKEDEGGGTEPCGFAALKECGHAEMDHFPEAQRLPGALRCGKKANEDDD